VRPSLNRALLKRNKLIGGSNYTFLYQELLSNLAEVAVAIENRDPSLTLCRDRYAKRLGFDWMRIIKKSGGHPIRQRTNPRWTTSPSFYFTKAPYKACKPLANDLPLNEKHHKQRDEFVALAVGFIYLHEIGKNTGAR